MILLIRVRVRVRRGLYTRTEGARDDLYMFTFLWEVDESVTLLFSLLLVAPKDEGEEKPKISRAEQMKAAAEA